jgi:hypothetical protein
MVIGSVRIVTIGLTTMLIKTRQAETMSAVRIEFTLTPATKYGSAKTARVVMNQRSKIIE